MLTVTKDPANHDDLRVQHAQRITTLPLQWPKSDTVFALLPSGTMAENKEIMKSLNMAHHEINKLKSNIDDVLGRQSEYDMRLLELEKIAAETKAYAEDLYSEP